MLVHHHHPDTGAYLGASEAHVDPEEHAQQQRALFAEREQVAKAKHVLAVKSVAPAKGRDWSPAEREQLQAAWDAYAAEVEQAKAAAASLEPIHFLLPANATFDQPPTPGKGKVIVRRAAAWIQVAAPAAEPALAS